MEEFGGSKDAHMMMMELPSMLDHMLHRIEARRIRIATGAEASEGGKADDEL